MKSPEKTTTDGWVWGMIRNHLERFPRGDWPTGGKTSALWSGWAAAFAANHVTQPEAEAASVRMMQAPPEYIDGHLGRLLELVNLSRCTQQNNNPLPPRAAPMSADDQAIVDQIVKTPRWWDTPAFRPKPELGAQNRPRG